MWRRFLICCAKNLNKVSDFMAASAFAGAVFSYKINLSDSTKRKIDCRIRPLYNSCQDRKPNATNQMDAAQERKGEA